MKIKAQGVVFAVVVWFLSGCSGVTSGRLHYLPTGTSYVDNDWKYMCGIQLYTYGLGQNIAELNLKDVKLYVADARLKTIMEDRFQLSAVTLDAEFELEVESHLTVRVYEVGNQFARDSLNVRLLKEGPRLRQTRKYCWKPATGMFELSEVITP